MLYWPIKLSKNNSEIGRVGQIRTDDLNASKAHEDNQTPPLPCLGNKKATWLGGLVVTLTLLHDQAAPPGEGVYWLDVDVVNIFLNW